MKESIKKIDDYFVELINIKMSDEKLDRYFYEITDLGGAIGSSIIALFMTVIGLLIKNKYQFIGLEALLSLGINQIFVQILKRTTKRLRPYDALENLNTFGIDMPDYSFPSGHTTASASLATTLILNVPVSWPLAVWFSLSIGISRIYLAVHYPSDVAAGFILGFTSAILTHYIFFNPLLNILLGLF